MAGRMDVLRFAYPPYERLAVLQAGKRGLLSRHLCPHRTFTAGPSCGRGRARSPQRPRALELAAVQSEPGSFRQGLSSADPPRFLPTELQVRIAPRPPS